MAIFMETTMTNSRLIHTNTTTSTVLCLHHVTKNVDCVFSTWIALRDHVLLTHTGLLSENTDSVSPQTALKVIISRQQHNTVTVYSYMCQLKYSSLLTVHGPSIAQSASKQFSFPVTTQTLIKRYTDRVQYIQKQILYTWIWIWRFIEHLWTWVTWSGCQQFRFFRLPHGLLVQWSHTQSPVLYMWTGTRSHSWSTSTVQYGMPDLVLYLTQDIWLYRQGRIHTVTRIRVKPASDLELIWVMPSPFKRNSYKITWMWCTGRDYEIHSCVSLELVYKQ